MIYIYEVYCYDKFPSYNRINLVCIQTHQESWLSRIRMAIVLIFPCFVLCTKLSCQGEELNMHLASVPIPKRVLYVFACMMIVKMK